MKSLYIVIVYCFCFLLLSCATLKKDKNNMVGKEVDDITSQDIDSDSKGSDSGSVDGLSTVYFDYDSAGLSESAKEVLMENMNWIQSNSTVTSLELEGHCDTMGSEAYNIGLGRRRAEAVKDFLIEKGISAGRLSVISYGEERPFSDTDHSKNRRVNFVPMY